MLQKQPDPTTDEAFSQTRTRRPQEQMMNPSRSQAVPIRAIALAALMCAVIALIAITSGNALARYSPPNNHNPANPTTSSRAAVRTA